MPIKIEIEDRTAFNDSMDHHPYRMKLFTSDKGSEELSKCDNKKQIMESKAAICSYCIHRETCLEEENKI